MMESSKNNVKKDPSPKIVPYQPKAEQGDHGANTEDDGIFFAKQGDV
jgi:hypothetical protein